ncbi:unnamed protein product, partial [Ectocarpus sp. 4 AP-2014]
KGLLAADLVGFHTYDYARHFLSACSRVLEVECSPRGIELNNRFMSLGVYPIGIDPDHVAKTLRKPWVQNRIKELSETFAGRKILLGVDRLDYIKGMPHKLLGLELFLNRYPDWRGKVTLIQVGVPSRTEVAEYRDLGSQVNELVGRINGNYGTLEYSPVHYINQSISQDELFAIYNVADVCLVTSVRDGMNLVSHEYVAAQSEPRRPLTVTGDGGAPATRLNDDGPGVLILSEFAGSAQSLSGAIRVNPWNTEELANAMHQALALSRVERELRQHKLYRARLGVRCTWWCTRRRSGPSLSCTSSARSATASRSRRESSRRFRSRRSWRRTRKQRTDSSSATTTARSRRCSPSRSSRVPPRWLQTSWIRCAGTTRTGCSSSPEGSGDSWTPGSASFARGSRRSTGSTTGSPRRLSGSVAGRTWTLAGRTWSGPSCSTSPSGRPARTSRTRS